MEEKSNVEVATNSSEVVSEAKVVSPETVRAKDYLEDLLSKVEGGGDFIFDGVTVGDDFYDQIFMKKVVVVPVEFLNDTLEALKILVKV